MTPDVVKFCESQMKANAKTFAFASRFFSSENKRAAQALYAWCRFCDDQIDESKTKGEAKAKLAALFEKTESALRGEPTNELPFLAIQSIFSTYRIPPFYALELLRGMEMDVEDTRYRTEAELKLYCYRVAGVVGLMMTHIMGINDPRALKNAADAGIAMQMTNIARDVADDLRLGRVYLPARWFDDAHKLPLAPGQTMDGARAWPVVSRLLEIAESHYDSGRKGLKHLPLTAAFAISAAIDIYEDIGRVVRERKENAWTERAFVPTSRKVALIFGSSMRVLKIALSRAISPWRAQPIPDIYRL